MSRALAAVSASLVAWWFAAALGVPVWRDWLPGDRCDIALCTFLAVLLFARARPKAD